MSTDQIQKTVTNKLTIIRDILNSQYGVVGLLAALFYVIGQLSPHEYDQATHFVSHTVDQLNNPVGVSVIVFFLLVFFNKTFFQKYLEKQVMYAEAVKDFESTMQRFTGQCTASRESRRADDKDTHEQLQTVNAVLSRFYADFKEHEHFAVEVNNRVQMDLTPNIKRILDYVENGPK